MSKTNSLMSHHGESSNSRADKMSGWASEYPELKGKSKSYIKKFSTRKRRMFLKNPENFDKV